ncbi:MAG: GTP-binding protein [Gemmatimonadetes bacterium]|nr:MAG: GTP-binding protein [Gemmatimonadota bacterium]PYP06504.1 MAG: GTP-binding protein [Gemmatimonadota bacterium]PYP10665.1 MAG: GTP-binding protein [Gemmatimonadota bacterium]PYP80777.1 MAG: GTP-binding protein [Gemmatimonadota bacterium]
MIVVRQAGVLLLAALLTSRGLFAQDSAAVATASPTDQVASPADQVKVLLRPTEIRYVHQESVLLPPTAKIKGLYVNAWAFGSPKLWQLVRLADETEINAFVVDVKDDTGCLLYPSTVPTAEQIGANRCVRAKDARARLDTLAKHGIYAIARIVVAKDPLLAERKSGWSVKERGTGQLWRDRINIAWVDAYNDSVWIYAAQLAQEAAQMGFREVQFDYVRFPDEPRERMATAIFPAHRSGQTQREAVREHVALLKDRLKASGVPVTFDIFGLTASATSDLGIGQVWEDFVSVADVVLPMVYPSHYYRGAFGYAWPNGQPYRVVRRALTEALKRSEPLPGSAEIRPFLQAFTLGRRLPRYTPFEIREQIRAVEDLGITSWVLWNPRSVYQRGSLRPKQGAESAAGQGLSSRGGR